jgi:hypothetical protein
MIVTTDSAGPATPVSGGIVAAAGAPLDDVFTNVHSSTRGRRHARRRIAYSTGHRDPVVDRVQPR